MIIIFLLVVGICVGLWRARKLGGDRADMAQYAAVFGLIFSVIGAVLTVVLMRQG